MFDNFCGTLSQAFISSNSIKVHTEIKLIFQGSAEFKTPMYQHTVSRAIVICTYMIHNLLYFIFDHFCGTHSEPLESPNSIKEYMKIKVIFQGSAELKSPMYYTKKFQ